MPHVIVKLWPGKTEAHKQTLAEQITANVMQTLHYGGESVSVAFEEIGAQDWPEQVYRPDILEKRKSLYKVPGYSMCRCRAPDQRTHHANP